MGGEIRREKLLYQLFGQSAVLKQQQQKKQEKREAMFEGKNRMRNSRSAFKYSQSSQCGKPSPKQAVDSVAVSPGRVPKWLKCYSMRLMDTVLLLGARGK